MKDFNSIPEMIVPVLTNSGTEMKFFTVSIVKESRESE